MTEVAIPLRSWRHNLADIVALAKPRIALLALITTAAGIFLATGEWRLSEWVLPLFGTLCLVSGASALNMFLERDIDGHMTRTRDRPLPGKRLSPDFGLGFGSLLVGLAIPLLMSTVNVLTGLVGLLSLVIYVLVYTPLKQKTSLSLLVGAIPGAAPPLLGWTAATGRLSAPGWVLFGIVFLWQMPHFLAIGTFRREEYAEAGFKIFPLQARSRSIKGQTLLFTLLLIPVSLALVPLGYAGKLYGIGVMILDAAFLGAILWKIGSEAERAWGRRVFRASLLYLTALFGLLFLDGGKGIG